MGQIRGNSETKLINSFTETKEGEKARGRMDLGLYMKEQRESKIALFNDIINYPYLSLLSATEFAYMLPILIHISGY